ncbi:MAG TPA: c-type cytochrome [Steroidobacteraceae bacterium]|nr:c-type cytochrome [Steroidobacteraceae bacterium]
MNSHARPVPLFESRHSFFLAILATAMSFVAPEANAQTASDAGHLATLNARNLAVGVCGTCHGARGNSVQPKFPRLAGQDAGYLAAQLRNFRSQTRGDPDAIGYMWGMAAELSDETIEALAKYYAGQKPVGANAREVSAGSHGREIYERGIAAEGVPACAACHGADAHGTATFPRLAGQHAQYVLKQLGSFQTNMRNVAVMHGVALNLRLSEMEEVAAYLESLP